MQQQVVIVKAVNSDELQTKINEKLNELTKDVVHTIIDVKVTSNGKEYLGIIIYYI